MPATACVSIVAGIIHAFVTPAHLDEYVPFGAFFIAIAAAQLAWGIAVWRRPTRRTLRAGAALNLGLVGVWLGTRTVAVPLGPDAGEREAVGVHDVFVTLDELFIAVVALALLRYANHPRPAALIDRIVPTAGTVLAALSLTSLMALGGHH